MSVTETEIVMQRTAVNVTPHEAAIVGAYASAMGHTPKFKVRQDLIFDSFGAAVQLCGVFAVMVAELNGDRTAAGVQRALRDARDRCGG